MTTWQMRPLNPQEPPARTTIDSNDLLVDLARAELDAVTANQPAEAAGLVTAQAIVRRFAGIPTGAD